MNGFQLVSISIALGFCIIVVVGLAKRRILPASGLFWLAAWLGAIVAISKPDLTRMVAQSLGIARGADLVFYCAILAMFIGFFLVYAKLRRLEQAMTQIARELAIRGATTSDTPSPGELAPRV